MRVVDHWINGECAVAANVERFEATDPRTRQASALVALGSARDVDHAIESASEAWRDWSSRPPAVRGRVLMAIARTIRDHADELVAVERSETGKLETSARAEVEGCADYFDYYGGIIRSVAGETIDLGADQHAFTRREPYGVIGIITPWSGPIAQAGRGSAPALAAGNAVVIKPSEFTSSSTVLLATLMADAGLPPGLFNVVLGLGQTVGRSLVSDSRVARIVFTGSVATGRAIAKVAAERLVPVTLELGGKAPNIVFADADMVLAVRGAAGYLKNGGQICTAQTRLLVEESIHDQFVEALIPIVQACAPGEHLPPMTTEAHFQRVQEYFRVAEGEGARLVAGGKVASSPSLTEGRYVEATIYTGVTPMMRIFQEEVFGPILTVTPFRDEEHAVELANGTQYGLSAAVWTGDPGRALRVALRIDSGQVLVNGGEGANDVPFGGFKRSGIGREKGVQGLLDSTQLKAVVINIGRH